MKIISIHADMTSGLKSIVFNVDGPINDSVLCQIRMENVRLGKHGERLFVGSDEPITRATIEQICLSYAEFEERLAREEEAKKSKPNLILESVMASTGLPLDTVG